MCKTFNHSWYIRMCLSKIFDYKWYETPSTSFVFVALPIDRSGPIRSNGSNQDKQLTKNIRVISSLLLYIDEYTTHQVCAHWRYTLLNYSTSSQWASNKNQRNNILINIEFHCSCIEYMYPLDDYCIPSTIIVSLDQV